MRWYNVYITYISIRDQIIIALNLSLHNINVYRVRSVSGWMKKNLWTDNSFEACLRLVKTSEYFGIILASNTLRFCASKLDRLCMIFMRSCALMDVKSVWSGGRDWISRRPCGVLYSYRWYLYWGKSNRFRKQNRNYVAMCHRLASVFVDDCGRFALFQHIVCNIREYVV